MAKVEIFHNVAKDQKGRPLGFSGYEPGHELVKVFEVDVEATERTDARHLAEVAFALGNGQTDKSEDYYARRLRSVSVGDAVRVGEVWLSCDRTGWSVLKGHSPHDITSEHQGEHGTHRWQP
ncbi:hypothetical protein ACFOY4_01460 [Actinomadura syzygii]|uniref:Uncharacterized protein n=1 Tax=Actinomadura syzygii TaxID=1427538 RepID=A0A5D0TTE7_9ACTN|nr:hypothetical protein [Actinomadura syzygii]TYC08585.1 hypothetical protein FXF65_37465 [Actinomadura syzygii]